MSASYIYLHHQVHNCDIRFLFYNGDIISSTCFDPFLVHPQEANIDLKYGAINML
jgi:hypothetical protein